MGHAGVQVTASPPRQGALQQLVLGTNEVLVSTVTSASSSRRTSVDATVIGNITQSTNVSSEDLRLSDAATSDKVEIDDGSCIDGRPVVNGPAENTVSKTDGVRTEYSFNLTDLQDPKNMLNSLKNGQQSSETIPLQTTSRKSNGKPRFLRRDSKVQKDAITLNDLNSDDDANDGRTGKSFRDVKRIGIDLVEEVREKSREMRAWTALKFPHLQR